MSKPESGHSNVLGICLLYLDRIKGRVVVGPMKMEVIAWRLQRLWLHLRAISPHGDNDFRQFFIQ